MATRELLRAIEQTGTTNNIAIIKALEGRKMTALDRMQTYDAYIDATTHQVQQTIYLAKRNPKPADKTDLFEIVSAATPEQAMDTASLTACKLKSYADIPTYEQ
jgi:branched-chain amino acid transport system substrate-binding protein